MKKLFKKKALMILFSILMAASLMSATGLNSINAEEKKGKVTIKKISYIWYNGAPGRNPQPDNTFRYGDGTTHGLVFTSKPRNPNIETQYSDDLYSSAVRIKAAKLDLESGTASTVYIVVNRDNYVRELENYIDRDMTIEEAVEEAVRRHNDNIGPFDDQTPLDGRKILDSFRTNYGILPQDSFRDGMAKASGFSSWDNMIQTVKEQFYVREIGRLYVDGVTSWCIEPAKTNLASKSEYVNAETMLKSEQWASIVQLIVNAALDNGADKDNLNGNSYYFAAQTLIWEIVDGLIDYDTLNWKDNKKSGYYKGIIEGNNLTAVYNAIKTTVNKQRYENMPSFLTSEYDYLKTGKVKTYTYPYVTVNGSRVLAPYILLHDVNGAVSDYQWPENEYFSFEAMDDYTLKVIMKKEIEKEELMNFISEELSDDTIEYEIIATKGGQGQITFYEGIQYTLKGYMSITMNGTHKQDGENGFYLYGDVSDTKVTITGGRYDGKQEYDLHSLPQLDETGVTYIIKEVHAPVYSSDYIGYVLNDNQVEVKVTGNSETSWGEVQWSDSLKDFRQKGQIEIQKTVNGENSNLLKSLQGAVFGIYAKEDIVLADDTVIFKKGELVETVTTDDKGKAVSSLLELGIYEVKELKAPFGTVLNENSFTADIKKGNENQEVIVCSITVSNDVSGYLTFTKSAEVLKDCETVEKRGYSIKRFVFEERPLASAKFDIYAAEDIKADDGTVYYEKDELVDSVVTNAEGKAESCLLSEGKYYLQETQTVEGYVLSDKRYDFEISESGNCVIDLGNIVNERQKACVEFEKLYEYENEETETLFGLFLDSEIESAEGIVIAGKGDLIDVIRIENGFGRNEEELVYGSYHIKELSTDNSYMLDYNSYDFSFEYSKDNEKEEVITLHINNDVPLVNNRERARVKLIKYDENAPIEAYLQDEITLEEIMLMLDDLKEGVYGNVIFRRKLNSITIPDTEFTLYDSSYNVIETVITDEKGEAEFRTMLAKGTYILKETRSNGHYRMNEEETVFTITDEYQDVTLNFAFSNLADPGIVFIKINRHDELLPGCEISIFDMKDNEIMKGITDSMGRLFMTALNPGEYYWQETKAPDGYSPQTEKHYFEITESGTVIYEIITDDSNGGCRFIYENGGDHHVAFTGDRSAAGKNALICLLSVMSLCWLRKREDD